MNEDYRDIALADLADENADLREANRQLVDLIADLAYENALLRAVWNREYFERLHGDVTIAALWRRLDRRAA